MIYLRVFNLESALGNHLGIFFSFQINSGLYLRLLLREEKLLLKKLLMTEAIHTYLVPCCTLASYIPDSGHGSLDWADPERGNDLSAEYTLCTTVEQSWPAGDTI